MLRTITIHRSLHRANTFMGGDREIIMLAGLIAVASIAVGQNLISATMGIIFWFLVLIPARKIAKKDPHMRGVLFASLHFRQKYYPPHSHILAKPNNNYKTTLSKNGMSYKR